MLKITTQFPLWKSAKSTKQHDHKNQNQKTNTKELSKGEEVTFLSAENLEPNELERMTPPPQSRVSTANEELFTPFSDVF